MRVHVCAWVRVCLRIVWTPPGLAGLGCDVGGQGCDRQLRVAVLAARRALVCGCMARGRAASGRTRRCPTLPVRPCEQIAAPTQAAPQAAPFHPRCT